MGFYSAVAVFCGAGIGALLRWALSFALNPVFPTIPLGTLASNLIGGLLVGVAVGFFSHNTSLPPEARLFAITGFLGGLTTFSTFSAEVVTLLGRTEYLWALAATGVHLCGSLLMTAVGMMAANAIFVRT
ncbi:MAG: fluoride efflux transporter CrcB [Rhodocyclaceae bacterium]|nr:fluoride efflux transporter CrcB [Rhodocyclaceae bacterium]